MISSEGIYHITIEYPRIKAMNKHFWHHVLIVDVKNSSNEIEDDIFKYPKGDDAPNTNK